MEFSIYRADPPLFLNQNDSEWLATYFKQVSEISVQV